MSSASSSLLRSVTRRETTRWMTVRYVLALGLVAALSMAAWLALRQAIMAQETAAAIINFSGQRRYLSQRAALACLQRTVSTDEMVRARAGNEALVTAIRLERAHDGLIHGDAELRLPGAPSPHVQALYFAGDNPLDPLVRDFLARVRSLATRDAVALDDADLRWVLDVADGRLLTLLDRLVSVYQAESEAEIARLQRTENMVLAATLIALVLEAVLIFRPMVQRVASERSRLVAAESYVRSVLDHCYDAVLVIAPDGRIEAANPAATRLLGCQHSALIGMPFRNALHLEDGDDDGMHSATIGADGRTRRLDVGFGSMTTAGGQRRIAIARESTVALQRHARDLERRNQELDQFAYVASHDLKAPLRAIANLSAWIEEDLTQLLDDQHRSQMHLLRERVKRLEGLIDGLHQYATAGRRAGTVETFALSDLVQEIVAEQDLDRRFTLDASGEALTVTTDRVRLWQVLSNLIANAIRHHHAPPGTLTVRWAREIDHLTITVADDGPGIDPIHHERIFTIFHTLAPKDRAPGLGLGLALVRKIVGDRGGEVSVTSSLGAGARFRFTWPLLELERDGGQP